MSLKVSNNYEWRVKETKKSKNKKLLKVLKNSIKTVLKSCPCSLMRKATHVRVPFHLKEIQNVNIWSQSKFCEIAQLVRDLSNISVIIILKYFFPGWSRTSWGSHWWWKSYWWEWWAWARWRLDHWKWAIIIHTTSFPKALWRFNCTGNSTIRTGTFSSRT